MKILLALLLFLTVPLAAQRAMEELGRGVIATRTGSGSTSISWRMLGSDDDDIAFNLYRSINGGTPQKLNASPLTQTTDYYDNPGPPLLDSSAIAYTVRPVIGGIEQAPSGAWTLPAASAVVPYFEVPFTTEPAAGGPFSTKFAWVGDFDGNGEYDFLCDRLPTDSNGGPYEQYLEAYLQDGTFLWRMNMGPNSTSRTDIYRPGASAISVGDGDNVTCFDLNGDGKAEAIVRTANGVTVENPIGNVVTTITASNNSEQFLTIIDGMTGTEITSAPVPNDWSQHGTLQSKCFIAYLDGKHPSVVLYGYNRASNGKFFRQWTAWDFNTSTNQLVKRWTWAQDPSAQPGSEGHQIRIGDVDNDGKDELIDIGHVIDDDGSQLYVTDLTHGDRFHLADINPLWPGLETYAIQQNNPTFLATAYMNSLNGFMYRKWYATGIVDVGRGFALDMDPNHPGLEMVSTQPGIFNAESDEIFSNSFFPYEALWWDGDTGREIIRGTNAAATSPAIEQFNPASGGNQRIYINGSNVYDFGVVQAFGGRPAFWGDILGDWREELVFVKSDFSGLRILTTAVPANDRRRTLMHNAQYRVQTTTKGYVQSSYVDYYLGFETSEDPPPPINDTDHLWVGASPIFDNSICPHGESILFDLSGSNAAPVALTGTLAPSRIKLHAPQDFIFDATNGSLTGGMNLSKSGRGSLTLTGSHPYTGPTEVWDGALIVDGSLSASPVTIHGGTWGAPLARGETGGRLGGSGTVAQPVNLAWRGAIVPGSGNGDPATLHLAGGLTLGADTALSLDISNNSTSDLVAITGNLVLSGPTTLVIHPLDGPLAPGDYTLITYTGSFNGSLANFKVDIPPGTPYSLSNTAGSLILTVPLTRNSDAVTWKGGTNGNIWDLATTANFLRNDTPETFVTGDTVTFDNTGSPHTTINLVGELSIGNVIVDSSLDYAFTGSGTISGEGGLTKSGTGTLIVGDGHDFTGPVTINGGTVAITSLADVGQPSSLGASSAASTNLVLNGGTIRHDGPQTSTGRSLRLETGGGTINTPSASLQIGGSLYGLGSLTKTGSGLLILGQANYHAGGTVIEEGMLQLATDTANISGLGSGPVTFRGGTLAMTDQRDVSSWDTVDYDLIVPAGEKGRLDADGRCYLDGTLAGAGEFTFYTPFVRTGLQADWSAFSGELLIITDADGGDLRLDSTSAFPNASLHLSDDTYTYYRPGMSENLTLEIGALAGDSGASLMGGPTAGRTLTWRVGGKNLDSTYDGIITNQGSGITALEKVGSGFLTLTGALNHSGSTTISSGLLRLEGSSVASDFFVQDGATLGGGGALTGDLAVLSGAQLELSPTSPLTITGNVQLTGSVGITSSYNPGLGTHLIATYSGNLTGTPALSWNGPGYYSASISTSEGQIALTLSPAALDTDGDLINDSWELAHFADLASCRPLDDPDSDGFNNWAEWKAGTIPTLATSYPSGVNAAVTTADGDGFDGALCEVNYSGQYDGGFFTNDTSRFRNNCYQNPGVRHYLTVLKFDLTPWQGMAPNQAQLDLFVNGSSYQTNRTLSAYQGDDALITPAIGYNAVNPFIDDNYTAETDTDTDFASGTVSELLSYQNGAPNTAETIGAGDANLLAVIQAALASDGFLTLLIHGGTSQYLTQADEDPDTAKRPTLRFQLPHSPNPDEDNDGLADAWEAQYFGTLATIGSTDSDGDGTPEWLEAALGLDPHNPAEAFTATLGPASPTLNLSWPNAPNLSFTVESSPDLTAASWRDEATFTGSNSPPLLTYPTTPSLSQQFFRVKAEPIP